MAYDNYINSILMNAKRVPQINYTRENMDLIQNNREIREIEDIRNEVQTVEKNDENIENEIRNSSNKEELHNELVKYYPEIYTSAIPIIKREIERYNENQINDEILNNIANTVYNNLEDNIKDIDYETVLKEYFKTITIDYLRMIV